MAPPPGDPPPVRHATPSAKPRSKEEPSLTRARMLAQEGDSEGAKEALRAAISADPGLEDAYLLLGSLHSMGRDLHGAANAYRSGLAKLPDSPALHHALGMLLLERSDLTGAVEQLERANTLDGGKSADIMSDLAYAFLFAARVDEAIVLAERARQLAPGSFAAAFTHAEALIRRDRLGEATSAIETALRIDPNDPLARRRLAALLAKQGQHERAVALYLALIREAPDDPRLHAAMAGALLELGRAKDAVRAMETAVRISKDDKALLELLILAQERAGDVAGAQESRAKLEKPKGTSP